MRSSDRPSKRVQPPQHGQPRLLHDLLGGGGGADERAGQLQHPRRPGPDDVGERLLVARAQPPEQQALGAARLVGHGPLLRARPAPPREECDRRPRRHPARPPATRAPPYCSLSRPLTSLPVAVRGSSATNSTVRGALNEAIRALTYAMISRSVPGSRARRRRGLHERRDRLAHVGVGHADDRDVQHGRVQREHVLDLLRVDVHPAGDDHERAPVGQEQVAVLVDVADVAERGPVGVLRVLRGRASSPGRCGSRTAACVALEVHRADLARRAARAPSSVADAQRRRAPPARPSPGGPATARCRSTSCRCPRWPRSTRTRIGPHQSIIARLTSTGHGAAAWIGDPQAATRRSASRTSSGSLSIRTNIVGTHWLCVTRYRSIAQSASRRRTGSISTTVPPRPGPRRTSAAAPRGRSGRGRGRRCPGRSRTARPNSADERVAGLVDLRRSGSGGRTPLGSRWCPRSRASSRRAAGRRTARVDAAASAPRTRRSPATGAAEASRSATAGRSPPTAAAERRRARPTTISAGRPAVVDDVGRPRRRSGGG